MESEAAAHSLSVAGSIQWATRDTVAGRILVLPARTMEGRVGLSLLRVHELSSGLRSGRRLDKRKAERAARLSSDYRSGCADRPCTRNVEQSTSRSP